MGRLTVVVGEDNNLAVRMKCAKVPRPGRARTGVAHVADAGIPSRATLYMLGCFRLRALVHDH